MLSPSLQKLQSTKKQSKIKSYAFKAIAVGGLLLAAKLGLYVASGVGMEEIRKKIEAANRFKQSELFKKPNSKPVILIGEDHLSKLNTDDIVKLTNLAHSHHCYDWPLEIPEEFQAVFDQFQNLPPGKQKFRNLLNNIKKLKGIPKKTKLHSTLVDKLRLACVLSSKGFNVHFIDNLYEFSMIKSIALNAKDHLLGTGDLNAVPKRNSIFAQRIKSIRANAKGGLICVFGRGHTGTGDVDMFQGVSLQDELYARGVPNLSIDFAPDPLLKLISEKDESAAGKKFKSADYIVSNASELREAFKKASSKLSSVLRFQAPSATSTRSEIKKKVAHRRR